MIASGFYSQSHGKRQIAGIDAQVTKTSSSNNTLPQSQAQFRAIEEIRVGDRVKTDVPEEVWATDFLDLDEESALAGPDVDPASWRLLRMSGETYEDGKLIDDHQIETLQHISWIQEYNVAVGMPCPVPLDLEEMDSDPNLQVKATEILPCPTIKPGKGRIVLTTVNHFNTDVWKVVVENENGQRETIEPTGRHPFYSATRQTAVATQDLEVGETLVGTDFDGEGEPEHLTVISLAKDPGKHRVYNLTVQGEHVYRVSKLGALAHNNYPGRPAGNSTNHHKANVTIRDQNGNLLSRERLLSGNMTSSERALGFPRNMLASHTEARAATQTTLQPGQVMTITGQRPPCPSCKGYMNQAARESRAIIIYRWRDGGITRTWAAGH
ncbi:MAG: polymorphic toxin-type HINT domain-containing protein [Pirellulales bacterium]